ncbi:hypothetical protein DFH08DRAFT_349471 [Mycena albidolilacea]|uniref:Uncharacterized protein n=1 Tax=Mycena albidolilacea TaxID=1033008 RepID=A0AAD6ZHU2_9AGAR|nr:hypothetical protein DFH08DRAFT_349471 [Mycena albidolilacea]
MREGGGRDSNIVDKQGRRGTERSEGFDESSGIASSGLTIPQRQPSRPSGCASGQVNRPGGMATQALGFVEPSAPEGTGRGVDACAGAISLDGLGTVSRVPLAGEVVEHAYTANAAPATQIPAVVRPCSYPACTTICAPSSAARSIVEYVAMLDTQIDAHSFPEKNESGADGSGREGVRPRWMDGERW